MKTIVKYVNIMLTSEANMSIVATLHKNIDMLNSDDIKSVLDYVLFLINNKKSINTTNKISKPNLKLYQSVDSTDIDANQYVKELRNDWD